MAQLIMTLLLDGVMALLLVLTTYYCWRLNKRIQVLQDSKSELAHIIQEFDESTRRATESIAEIHEATTRISENIQHKIDKANYLADDLQFMIEKGNKLAGKMETGISASRKGQTTPSSGTAADTNRNGKVVSDRPAKALSDSNGSSDKNNQRTRSSLEKMLNRVSGRQASADGAEEAEKASNASDARRRRVTGARLRSKAEQELFDALKTGDKA